MGKAYGESNVNDTLTGRTTLDYVTVFDLAAAYDYRGGEYQFIVKNLFNSYYEIGDAGGARPLPREGITLELAVSYLY